MASPFRLVSDLGRPAYEALLSLIGGGTTPWTINGETFRVDPRYRRDMARDHEPAVAALWRDRLAPGAVCFDVGANVGLHVLQMARRVGPTGRIVAFEPNPAAMKVLRFHVEANGFADRVTFVEAAAGASTGRAVLHTQGVDQRARLGSANAGLAGDLDRVEVPVVSLDNWAGAQGLQPDWLIVDVEGFEEEVIRGAQGLIAGHPSLGLVVEMHPDSWGDTGTTRASFSALLARLGRRPVSLTGLRDPLGGHNLTVLEPVPLI